MNPIETYVQAVTAQVHFFLDRGRIGDELRAHLQDSVEDLMQEEGLTLEQAQAEAAARMGGSAGRRAGAEPNSSSAFRMALADHDVLCGDCRDCLRLFIAYCRME